jgi:NSS family neurotransmitter:Na+ symporter
MLKSIFGFFGATGIEFEGKFFSQSFFDLIDYLTANIMLPLGGLLIAIFAGWIMSRAASEDEFAMKSKVLYQLWFVLVRYITPVAVIIVFLNVVGVIDWLSRTM